MKKTILFGILLVSIAINSWSQVPAAISYQAVVRNSSGEVITNQNVSFRISILQDSESGNEVYSETHNATTNNFGLANLKIGLGTIDRGVFSPSGWGMALHFIKVEFDPDGGSNYIHMSTSQLLSVPYAFHAQTVEEDNVDDADSDPFNEIQTLSIEGNRLELSDGGSVELPAAEVGDDWGSQVVETDASLNGDGTAENPLSTVGDNWGAQSVQSGATLTGEGTIDSPLNVVGDLTDNQQLSLVGNDLSISGGNTVTIPQSGGFWNKNNADELYYNLNVGIGTVNPQFELDIYDDASATFARIYSNANNAGLLIDRKSTSDMAYTRYSTSNAIGFYTGLLANNNYRISSDIASLKGIEVTSDGNINLSDNLLLASDKKIGLGTDNPGTDIDIFSPTASVNLKASSSSIIYGNVFFTLDKSSSTRYAQISYRADGVNKFYTGLLGNNNYKITSSTASLKGLEVEEDGNVVVSDELQTTTTGTANMLPIAYGTISSAGNAIGCTSNVSSIRESTGWYKVSIPNLGGTYSVIVSPSQGTAFLTTVVVAKSISDFSVAVWDTKNDTYYNGSFSFVVYRP